jgi:hypothetical protein
MVPPVIEWHEAMVHHEIVLPYTEPETEWVRGRALQKVSPKRTHSFLQGALTIELTRWAAGRGGVGPEWRFRVAPRARFAGRSFRMSHTFQTIACER